MQRARQAITPANIMRLGCIAVIVSFFLPWGTVNCQGAEVGTFNGWDLARGINVDDPSAGTGAREPVIFLVLLFALVALVVTLLVSRRWLDRLSADLGVIVLSLISLVVLYIKYRQLRDQARAGGAELQLRYGAWLTFAAEIVIVLAAIADLVGWWRAEGVAEEAQRGQLEPPEP